jgi:putative hemolysin
MINLIIIFVLSSMIFIINSTSVAIVKTNNEQLEDIFEIKKKSAVLIKKVSTYYRRFQTLTNISIYFMSFVNAFLILNLSQDNLFNASIYIFGYFLIYVLVLNHTARRIGLKYVERVATNFIGLYFIIFNLFYPITITTYFMSRLIAKVFGLNENLTDKEMAEEQIRTLVNESTETGVLDEEESEMIQNVFEFDDTEVYEVMTHRTDIKGFEISMSEKEIMEIFSKEPYTRYPVYKDNLDTILGTVHLKDFLPYMLGKRKKINLKSLMRKPYFIPESKKINDLMKEMQMTKNHIAIILDEYGGTTGLVTFENVIEELNR